jgi:hypothetical protein
MSGWQDAEPEFKTLPVTLSGENDASPLEDSTNTVKIDGVEANNISLCKVIFSRGQSKSNDRLKRVKGIGKARFAHDSDRAADPDDEAADMANVVNDSSCRETSAPSSSPLRAPYPHVSSSSSA